MYCKNCRKQINEDIKICPKCGIRNIVTTHSNLKFRIIGISTIEIFMNVDVVKNLTIPKNGICTKELANVVGTYVLKDNYGEIYVGSTKNINTRLCVHTNDKYFTTLDIYLTKDSFDARIMEYWIMEMFQPELNKEDDIYSNDDMEQIVINIGGQLDIFQCLVNEYDNDQMINVKRSNNIISDLTKCRPCMGTMRAEKLISHNGGFFDVKEDEIIKLSVDTYFMENMHLSRVCTHLKGLTNCAGTYVLKDRSDVLFVGYSKDISEIFNRKLKSEFTHVDIYMTANSHSAIILRHWLIKKLRPVLNKDTETYQKVDTGQIIENLWDREFNIEYFC